MPTTTTAPRKFKLVTFRTSPEDRDLIKKIVVRITRMSAREGISYDKTDADMDITATHANGHPLDLQRLLDAPDDVFGHDVYGIRRYLDRSTGELGGHFSPRCTLRP